MVVVRWQKIKPLPPPKNAVWKGVFELLVAVVAVFQTSWQQNAKLKMVKWNSFYCHYDH